jgi:osmoprotectant transport system substrate-binding protein
MKPSRLILALACSAALFAGCGEDEEEPAGSGSAPTPAPEESAGQIQRNEANSQVTLKIGSKNFTEQKVLGEIYAQGLEAAGYTVETDLNLGDEQTALKAVKGGEIDA